MLNTGINLVFLSTHVSIIVDEKSSFKTEEDMLVMFHNMPGFTYLDIHWPCMWYLSSLAIF